MNREKERLAEDQRREKKWRRWGPFLSERQWGTVREDYSDHGNSWASFPHDHSRRRAYRWGEDGLQGWTRPPVPPLLRPRPVERQGHDSQGAAFRARRKRGQPRRGREGVLLLPRFHAHAFLHQGTLQVSAGGISLHGDPREEPGTRPHRTGAGTRRHGHVRRRKLLRRRPGGREAVAGRHPVADHGDQPRPQVRAHPRAADPLVPQCLELGTTTASHRS